MLDKMLEPVTRCFNSDAARALLDLSIDDHIQARVEELAEKCNQGEVTADELLEYEAYVGASTLIGVLQARARDVLREAESG